jgi:hypothetical protein
MRISTGGPKVDDEFSLSQPPQEYMDCRCCCCCRSLQDRPTLVVIRDIMPFTRPALL